MSSRRYVAVVISWAVLFAAETSAATGNDPLTLDAGTQATQARVAILIEQLGAEAFVVRERAQAELRELGLPAFDALLKASLHDDVEISLRARYLVRSMPVRWAQGDDPPAVQSILRKYGYSGRTERRNRMQQLAALPDSLGVLPLCRLARFEIDASLSKEAALFVMNSPADQPAAGELAGRIKGALGSSQRSAVQWLRAYANSLTNPSLALEEWSQLTSEEQQTLARFPDRSDRYIVRDLLRWHADLLRSLDRQEEFLAAVRNSLDLVEGRLAELYDAVDWAADREAWVVVDEVKERFSTEFYSHAILVYRLAESQRKRSLNAEADQTAAQALAMAPNSPDDHVILADRLQSRMLYDWAEREYRFAIESTSPTESDGTHLEARFFLADMLFDLEQELAAAEVLEEMLPAVTENPKLLQTTRGRTVDEIAASIEYYRALHVGRLGDFEAQVEHLESAFALNSQNPDYLIALFRVPTTDPLRQESVKSRIETSKTVLRDRIHELEGALRDAPNETHRLKATADLAQALNELAWLTSNTFGDFSGAVQQSERSLQLRPSSPAYLDTLGRCYFSAGDLQSAVKYQKQAVERAPRYQQIRRQLQMFEDALARSNE